MFGVHPFDGPLAGPRRVCSMHHSYSSLARPRPAAQMVVTSRLGRSCRQAARYEARRCAVARELAVIMHCIWATGGEFEFGNPAAAAHAA
jgi:hypothetical protein